MQADTRYCHLAELYGPAHRIAGEALVGMVRQYPFALVATGKETPPANTYQQAAPIRRTALSDCGDVQRIRRTNHQEHGNYG